jgi:predicted metal-dependent TIM-barrel fold hydrolase
MLQFFDPHVRAEPLDNGVLEKLIYFNVRTMLIASHAPRRFENGDDLLNYFGEIVSNDVARLRAAGIRPLVALGVHPEAAPRRTYLEFWRSLPGQLEDPSVVAIGELALQTMNPRQEALLERQLCIAADRSMPVLVTSTRRERARKVRRILEIAKSVGLHPRLLLVNHLDATCIRPVLDAGCWAGLGVGPLHLSSGEAAQLLISYGEEAFARTLLSSNLCEEAHDVLALPRTAVALSDRGVAVSDVRRVVWGNATRLFGA